MNSQYGIISFLMLAIAAYYALTQGLAVSSDGAAVASAWTALQKSIQQKDQLEQTRGIFISLVSTVKELPEGQERILYANKILDFLELPTNKETLSHLFAELPMLANNTVFGNDATIRTLVLMRKHGSLSFGGIRNMGNGQVAAELSCPYQTELNHLVLAVCDTWTKRNTIDKTEVNKLCAEADRAYSNKQKLVLPEKNTQDLIRIYYATSDMKLQKIIIACLLMNGDFKEASNLLRLIVKQDASAARAFLLAIPTEYRGKGSFSYQEDADELK